MLPVCQTLFYFNENTVTEAEAPEKGAIIFASQCDLHAIKRFDYHVSPEWSRRLLLQTRPRPRQIRPHGLQQEFENCFCVSMGTNTSDNYDVALNFKDGQYFLDVKDDVLGKAVTRSQGSGSRRRPPTM